MLLVSFNQELGPNGDLHFKSDEYPPFPIVMTTTSTGWTFLGTMYNFKFWANPTIMTMARKCPVFLDTL